MLSAEDRSGRDKRYSIWCLCGNVTCCWLTAPTDMSRKIQISDALIVLTGLRAAWFPSERQGNVITCFKNINSVAVGSELQLLWAFLKREHNA